MRKAITIHEAKTHFSKYVKQAKAGNPVVIGSYGQEEVMLVPAQQQKKPFKLGVWKDKALGYKDEDIIGPDPDIIKDFEDAISKPFPGE